MLKVRCIDIIRKNNKITGYRLKDEHGKIKEVTSKKLKDAIKSKHIQVENLKLTSDDRLIRVEKSEDTKDCIVLDRHTVQK